MDEGGGIGATEPGSSPKALQNSTEAAPRTRPAKTGGDSARALGGRCDNSQGIETGEELFDKPASFIHD